MATCSPKTSSIVRKRRTSASWNARTDVSRRIQASSGANGLNRCPRMIPQNEQAPISSPQRQKEPCASRSCQLVGVGASNQYKNLLSKTTSQWRLLLRIVAQPAPDATLLSSSGQLLASVNGIVLCSDGIRWDRRKTEKGKTQERAMSYPRRRFSITECF